jgi:hypothetical protein
MALSPVNTVDLFTKVTKSVVINGFDFISALEHTLKQCLTLERHTNVVHIHPSGITKYIWAHRDYQPWGKRLPLQCWECRILNPWVSTFVKAWEGYKLECKNPSCGMIGSRRVSQCGALDVKKPEGGVLLSTGRESKGSASGWLKLCTN